jgi:hypothetical protein
MPLACQDGDPGGLAPHHRPLHSANRVLASLGSLQTCEAQAMDRMATIYTVRRDAPPRS